MNRRLSAIATRQAASRGTLQQGLETMEKMRKRRDRTRRHAKRLARRAVREAGTRRDVARALGKSESTVSHEVTDRFDVDLARAFEKMILLDGHPGVDARAFSLACTEAFELAPIVLTNTGRLIERGLYLMSWENVAGQREDDASITRKGHPEWLRRVADASLNLAMIIDELETPERGLISLHELYEERASAT